MGLFLQSAVLTLLCVLLTAYLVMLGFQPNTYNSVWAFPFAAIPALGALLIVGTAVNDRS